MIRNFSPPLHQVFLLFSSFSDQNVISSSSLDFHIPRSHLGRKIEFFFTNVVTKIFFHSKSIFFFHCVMQLWISIFRSTVSLKKEHLSKI